MSCQMKHHQTTQPPPILKSSTPTAATPKHSVRFQELSEKTTKTHDNDGTDVNVNANTFWSDNPNVLLNSWDFYPLDSMTLAQKLNAITRSLLVLSLVALFFTGHPTRLLFISLMSMVGIWGMYEYYRRPSPSSGVDHQEGMLGGFNRSGGGGDSGYLDETAHATTSSVPTYQQPTPENPFGNVLVTDYEGNPHKLSAPPASHAVVQNLIEQNARKMVQEVNPGQPNIGDKLFRDINEQLSFEQSMRPFHSNAATTIPNDQGAFAQFCYGDMISCKEGNLVACSRNTGHYTNY